MNSNIIYRDLSTPNLSPKLPKRNFALIGISPFNSYFSSSKILELCQYVANSYNNFAIFIPDKISKFTLTALGYDDNRIHHKVRKQDNYTINKVNKALLSFYQNNIIYPEIKIYNISILQQNITYQQLYKYYKTLFLENQVFRKNCLEVTEWVLYCNKKHKNEPFLITDQQKHIAVEYFLSELPIMANMSSILNNQSCDFIYHTIPSFLKKIFEKKEFISSNQNFCILK